ncbi:MAG: UDP-N-acetylmuramate dehydrogenase [Campylobacter sp.]|nr:UDP-N-acetylmuramate dehydrogenase [Campylobacter sp.]
MRVDFSKFSSVKIGAELEVAELNEVCDFDGFIIGNACNLLVGKPKQALAMLGGKFDYIKLGNDILRIGAKTSAKEIFAFAKKHDLKGFELCGSVPGSLGGLIKMNAGLKGYSISDTLLEIGTSSATLSKDECGFAYRKSDIKGVIFEAVFRAVKGFDEGLLADFNEARKNQPKGASFGSIFKNPPNNSAGRLIEAVGLKGYKTSNCELSARHANFLINHGKGSFNEAFWLINLAKSKVKESFGIELETEVVILN